MHEITLESIECPVCKDPRAQTVESNLIDIEEGVPGVYGIQHCQACDLNYLSPRPIPAHLDRCYPPTYHTLSADRFSGLKSILLQFRYRNRLRRIQWALREKSQNARILELGSGDGAFLGYLKTHLPSAQLTGIDFKPSPH
jgi:hypothetical protein